MEIGKRVEYENLEKALLKAAEEMGWKANFQDKFDKNYKLGSVKEVQEYASTHVRLRGTLFDTMQVIIYGKKPQDYFFIRTGFPWGITSEKKVQKYLSAVSENL